MRNWQTVTGIRSVWIGLAAAGALAAAGCSPDSDGPEGFGSGASDDMAVEEGALNHTPGASLASVQLTDQAIHMPEIVPAGVVAFSVTNSGTEAHSFQIQGEGLERRLGADLPPGQTRTLEVELRPGEYTVSCPTGDHAQRGLSGKLTAVASTS